MSAGALHKLSKVVSVIWKMMIWMFSDIRNSWLNLSQGSPLTTQDYCLVLGGQLFHRLYNYSHLVVLLYFMNCLSLAGLFSVASDLLAAQNKISGSLITVYFENAYQVRYFYEFVVDLGELGLVLTVSYNIFIGILSFKFL